MPRALRVESPGVMYHVINRGDRRVGHLFQGRFKAVMVQDDAGGQEVARYMHLNPVRVAGLALGKRERAASRAGAVAAPEPEVLTVRLRRLREYRWSSYRGYAGYGPALAWVWPEPLGRLCGGTTEPERQAALREYTEQAVCLGAVERPWERLVAGLVPGTKAFARSLSREVCGNAREQAPLKALAQPVA